MILSHAVSRLASADQGLMLRLHGWRPPRWLRYCAIAATRCGDGWLWVLLGGLLFTNDTGTSRAALLAAGLSVSAGILLFTALKRAIRRPRPCAFTPHRWSPVRPPDEFSFPSGHSITAFAVAISLGLFHPSGMPALLFCAASIAASRVLLGVHYLSDVLAGAVIGTALAYVAVALVS
jgi:undecaprenyl-diphosphatase